MDSWTKELTASMIPDGLCRAIAEEIGADNLLKLCALVGGCTFYIPTGDRLLRPLRDRKIREEFNGYNHRELARKYHITERHVLRIIHSDKEENKT